MTVEWYGLSCFRLEADGRSLVMDPYSGVRGYPDIHQQAHYVLKSHNHGDHAYLSGVELLPSQGPSPFFIETLDSWHDGQKGKLRGPNIMHKITSEGVTVLHMGDLGHVPSPELYKKIGKPDLLLIPVGGYYTIDGVTAANIVRHIGPKAVIPMHYRTETAGHEAISGVEEFLRCFAEDEIHRLSESKIDMAKTQYTGILLPVCLA